MADSMLAIAKGEFLKRLITAVRWRPGQGSPDSRPARRRWSVAILSMAHRSTGRPVWLYLEGRGAI